MTFSKQFDGRTIWSLSKPQNQYECESCWAFSTALCFSDRLRISGHTRVDLNPNYMVKNKICNSVMKHFCKLQGCGSGGAPLDIALEYLVINGCQDKNSNKIFNADSYYRIQNSYDMVSAMSDEIQNRGPVVAGFLAYENYHHEQFDYYYNTKSGRLMFKHAICIVGWKNGPNEKSYWICRNSYGTKYMDGGYFYILRGSNFCDIESYVWAINV